jgi:predicted dehydrogenase
VQRPIGWGILGTGNIATQFAAGFRHVPDARLLAVASRTRSKADEFANTYAVPRAYGSYEDLVADKDVDVVYIATPNHLHKDHCLVALEAGKAVLCEKPFAMDAREAQEVVNLARRKQLFCMEAMWMRFLPAMRRLRALLDDRVIGDIRLVRADFAIPKPFAENSRFFNPQMGGGAMLNYGIYLVSFAFVVLGKPCDVDCQATIGATEVDEQSVALLRYPSGALAALTANIRNYLPCAATIVGSHGQIEVHPPLFRPERFTVSLFADAPLPSRPKRRWVDRFNRLPLAAALSSKFEGVRERLSRRRRKYRDPLAGNGFNYEAAEVTRCLLANDLESPIMPLDETLAILETMDAIRARMPSAARLSAVESHG